jgi:predicted nucleic acid-binding protein
MNRIILDTNVVSETARPRPSELVAAWFVAQAKEHLFLTATVLGELAFGAAKLFPRGDVAHLSKLGCRICYRISSPVGCCHTMPRLR